MDGHQYHLTGGEAFLIPASVEAWYEADMDNPWTYRWVGFGGMTAEEVIHVSGFSRENSGPKDPLHGKCGEVY